MSIPVSTVGETLANLAAGLTHIGLHNLVATALNLAKPAIATGSTDPTIASATIAALADPTVTLTTKVGAIIDVDFRCTVSCTGADLIQFYTRVDGGSWQSIGDIGPTSSGRWAFSGIYRFTGQGASSHTIEVGWANTTGTATNYGTTRKLRCTEHYPG